MSLSELRELIILSRCWPRWAHSGWFVYFRVVFSYVDPQLELHDWLREQEGFLAPERLLDSNLWLEVVMLTLNRA